MVQRRSWEFNLLPIVLMIMGLVLMAIAFILTTTRTYQGGMWMDQAPSTLTAYTATNLLIAIVGAFMFSSGLMYLFLRQEYEPLPPSAMPALFSTGSASVAADPLTRGLEQADYPDPHVDTVPVAVEAPIAARPPSATMAPVPDNGHLSAHYLALRLLTGDERAMFRAIMDSGGEALQKDLIVKTKMSDAKVSRVIDRLEEKGVVTRMRFGMTNKVSIEIEP